jgi:hypothetical protein
MWFERSFSTRASLIFLVAASPFVISYLSNRDFVDDKISRSVLFAICLVSSSVLVDISTLLIFQSNYTPLWLGGIYFSQSVAYVGLGHLTLGRDDRIYNPGV